MAAFAHNEVAQTRYKQLQNRTDAFCKAFLDLANNPPDKILAEHFTTSNPSITEHGPQWASARLPFLGRTFRGTEECLEYFKRLAETLEFIPDENTFPTKEVFVIDDRSVSAEGAGTATGQVSVVGKAKFKAVKTGKAWDEQFIYRLSEFDRDGKIGYWEIWADPLSAWEAVGPSEE